MSEGKDGESGSRMMKTYIRDFLVSEGKDGESGRGAG